MSSKAHESFVKTRSNERCVKEQRSGGVVEWRSEGSGGRAVRPVAAQIFLASEPHQRRLWVCAGCEMHRKMEESE